MHVQLDSEDEWHAIGDALAPKDPWQGILKKPGTRTLLMQDGPIDGRTTFVKVEPSQKCHPGIYVEVNSDCVPPADAPMRRLIEVVEQESLAIWESNSQMARKVAPLRKKP